MFQEKGKNCTACGELLTANNFKWYRAKNYIWVCNGCMTAQKREAARTARKKRPEQFRDRSIAFRNRLRANNPKRYTCCQMRSSASKRAKALSMPFDITSDYLQGIAPDRCPVFHWPLNYGGGDRTNASPALDRIDSSKGYTIGNVQIISQLANLMKSNANEEELSMFANWVLGK